MSARVPGLPGRVFRTPLGALYATGYLIGGEGLLLQLVRHYGPLMSVPVLGLGDLVFVSDPVLAKGVLTASPEVLLGGDGVGPAAAIYGAGSMFVQEEPAHLRRRKMLTAPLHGAALDSYVPIMAQAARDAMCAWPIGEPFRMLDAARTLMLDVIVRVLFGVEDPDEIARIGHPFEQLLDLGTSEQVTIRYALRRVGTLKVWPELARVNAEIDSLISDLIAQRRSDPDLADRTDVLSLLVRARDDGGVGLSDKEIRDDLVTLMLAGHETTATTLANVMDLLLHHPDAMHKVCAEAAAGESTFTTSVINETLRLRPPVPFTARVAATEFTLGDYTIRAGTRLVVYINAINHHPDTYARPDEFVPERFVDQRPNTYAWLPFGGGIKRCLGAAFSLRELTTVLHVIVREGQFAAVSDQPDRMVRRSVVLVPRQGARLTYRPVVAEATTAHQ
ncbi:cytochrome P450 [Mycobacterium sp. CBMA 234]|uniref:cytochrome P450 n=1 Tax=Mycolicibacterium sp. CBMA 234 TaxID=1918495 RepID=UPI0012DD0ACA|nr:cytochrome P450 [Mycolicibacterium sp. CBMA 234]MUL64158.1 cytochrome P450 [Mycolicibacterium sp. CBMA 234]